MLDAKCTYGEEVCTYSILGFQELSETDIEKYRQFLECTECKGKAFFRKKSSDGKGACFGSRYHTENCGEGGSSPQRERESRHAVEVNQIISDSNLVSIDFFSLGSKSSSEPKARPSKSKPSTNKTSKTHSGTNKQTRIKVLGMEKVLNSLMRGSDLAESSILIEVDNGYKYKAKNLFVNFADAEASDSSKDAKPKMYWGAISHSDKELEWLNPSDCNDIGIPIYKHKSIIFDRFKVEKGRDLEGAGIILFGKCFWNSKKTRKIIELWNSDRIFISIAED
ncbi:hypothetical protein MK852_23775 [Shewanella benthica]|uniref:hypothetical protein n=1 Tax=Shewanella benthica TaxID=43661 RepID=UPI00187ADCD1|nr:hypothetical protein [Shewanella benthica]MBE7216384.1 hypothetical protein [Shewanella benthica]MCL1065114.1 hypothetical protein [Shewanella benthica]